MAFSFTLPGFVFPLKHTDYLHEATFRKKKKKKRTTKRKTKEKHLCLQKEGQHIACIILEVVKILEISG